jgi:hypothetical protein
LGKALDTHGAAGIQWRPGNAEVQLMPTATVSESDLATSASPSTGERRDRDHRTP